MNDLEHEDESEELSPELVEFLGMLDRGEIPKFHLDEINRQMNKVLGVEVFKVDGQGEIQ